LHQFRFEVVADEANTGHVCGMDCHLYQQFVLEKLGIKVNHLYKQAAVPVCCKVVLFWDFESLSGK
jgi:hypothetical protein